MLSRFFALAGLLALAVNVAAQSTGDLEKPAKKGDGSFASDGRRCDFRLLATNRTSTMEEEMDEAAEEGYRFEAVMGGETAFGGSEVVVVMSRDTGSEEGGRYDYKLLATSKTSTMQRELQELADLGFEYKGQTVFETTFGGREVVVILERDREKRSQRHEYLLLATSRTSTMDRELREAGELEFEFVGMTVAETAFGGNELVCILRRGAGN